LKHLWSSHISAEKIGYPSLFDSTPPTEPRMASRVVSLRRHPVAPAVGRRLEKAPARRHVWQGASRREYLHDVYSLIECPPLPQATYVLVRRDVHGRCEALHVGVGCNEAPTLNLADVRQRGALVGANEVHVHLDVASDVGRRLVACDLRAGLFGSLARTADADNDGF
jgi:hypothetical protein